MLEYLSNSGQDSWYNYPTSTHSLGETADDRQTSFETCFTELTSENLILVNIFYNYKIKYK